MELLNELLGYKSVKDKSLGEFLWSLEGSGELKKLGAGAYGIAYEIPGRPFVYKIWMKDPGYESFIKLALQHQDNLAFPRFYGKIHEVPLPFKRDARSPDMVKVIRTEKLETNIDRSLKLMDSFSEWYKMFKDAHDAEEFIKKKEDSSEKLEKQIKAKAEGERAKLTVKRGKQQLSIAQFYYEYLWASRSARNRIKNIRRELDTIKKTEVDFIKALMLTSQLPGLHSGTADLHAGNVLWRGNHPVISDPLVLENSIGIGSHLHVYDQDDHVKKSRPKKSDIDPDDLKAKPRSPEKAKDE